MNDIDVGTKQVILRIKPSVHKQLVQLTLKRSVEIGRKVGMGFVIEEMLSQQEQMDDSDLRSSDLFRTRD
jgi:hypothetical protein